MWPEYCIIGLLLIACLVLCAENLDLRRDLRDAERKGHALRRWGSAWKEKAEFLLNCHHPGWQFSGEPDYFGDKEHPVPSVTLTMPDVCAKIDEPKPNGDPEEKLE